MKIMFMPSDNYDASGAFLSMVQLIKCLHIYDIETLVILPSKGTGTRLLESNGINYKIVPTYNWNFSMNKKRTCKEKIKILLKKILNLRQTYRLKYIIKKEKCDLVHINTSYSYVGAEAAKKADVPVVWHLREFMEEDQNATFWNKKQSYKLIGESSKIIAVSESIAQKYRTVFSKGNLTVIYNGINTIFYNKEKEIMNSDLLKIVLIGTISEKKGQLVAVKAIAELIKNTDISVCVKIVGYGSEEYLQYLHNEVKRLELNGVIEFVGKSENVKEYYDWADISIVSSAMEAFGRVTVEGMMAGCLVIGSNTGGTKELIEDGVTGIIFEQGSSHDLFLKIKKAVDNKELSKQIANNGRYEAMSKYTAERNAKEIVKVYEDVLGKK